MAKKFLLLTPFLFATAILVGCGGGLGSTTKPDPASPGTLTASNSSVDFGQVAVGGNKTSSLTITNSSSSASVTVSQISLTGSRFSLVSPPSTPLTLGAGQSTALSVKFSPTAGGSASGTLTLTSDASDTSLDIPLSGNGQSSGQLSASPSSLGFGSVSVGSTKTSSVTITNSSSSASVTVSQISLTGSRFSLVSPPSTPLTLAAGQSTSLSVKFTPAAGGSATGTVTLTSNASDTSFDVALSGTGLAAGQLSASPSTLSFGTVTVGSSKNLTGTLTAGSADVTVSSASWSGSGYAVSGISFPFTIAAGNSVSYSVTFAPQSAGSASGSISFTSNASNTASQTFSGTGAAAQASHSVSLSWASANTATGYNVYRGTVSGGPYTKLTSSPRTSTSYTDSGVSSGATYFYVATSVNSSSVESGYSNEVVAVIP
ncbi:MAG: choice-of-anchor D domain-containing protein [Acidobacteria bacterium]|nr:choice-of-anchor D domain-containing protein [Acidobacteriota bacterium]